MMKKMSVIYKMYKKILIFLQVIFSNSTV